MSRTERALELERRYLSPATRIAFIPTVIDRGAGCEFVDADGRAFLDFHSMGAILNTGYNHPRVVGAICNQAQQLVHSNSAYVVHENVVELAAQLAHLAPIDAGARVAFGLSGSDANDGAIKLVRAATGRPLILAYRGAYHGNTYGALSLSAVSANMRRGFDPAVPGVHHLPFPDPYRMPGCPDEIAVRCLAEIERLFETVAPPEDVAAVVIEPIQGDAGMIVPPARYVEGLQELCRRHGILVVAEEVQTGIGRTGGWFASSMVGLEPDVVLAGKALGSGMPVSAIVARTELMDHWAAPGHVFCTAANPICCAAALATLQIVADEGLIANATRMGERLRTGLASLAAEYEAIGDIRGAGLMLGVDLVEDRGARRRARRLAAAVVAAAYRRGLFVTFVAGSVLRLAPPLTLTSADADRALAILAEAFNDAVNGRVAESAVAAVIGW